MIRKAFGVEGGEVWLWGREDAFSGSKPLLLVLTGAFAQATAFFRTPDVLPEADVLIGHFPGNHCPTLASFSVLAAARAYDEAIQSLNRPVVICGSSLGALVALSMRSTSIRRLVLLDPPLLIGLHSPLRAALRPRLAGTPDAALKRFLWAAFGVGKDRDAVRDYRPLLKNIRAPTLVIAGGAGPGSTALPGLLGPQEQDRLRAHPLVTLEVAPSAGHNIPLEAERLVLSRMRESLS